MSKSDHEERFHTVQDLRERAFRQLGDPLPKRGGHDLDPEQFGTQVAKELLDSVEKQLRQSNRD